MSIDETMKEVVRTLEHEVGVKAVFGEPVKLDNHTVVPVAMVGLGGGGGLGRALLDRLGRKAEKPEKSAAGNGDGRGAAAGALALGVRPIGFIHESGDEVIFTPIPTRGRENPFTVQAASSLGHLVNAFAGLFAKRP